MSPASVFRAESCKGDAVSCRVVGNCGYLRPGRDMQLDARTPSAPLRPC